MRSLAKIFVLIVSLSGTAMAANEYEGLRGKIRASLTQMHGMENEINHLIKEKRASTDPNEQRRLMDEMVKDHKDLRDVYQQYEENLDRLKYEFPDKGEKSHHKYSRFRLRSLEEMEKGAGLDGELDDTKAQLQETYGPLPQVKKQNKAITLPPTKKDEDEEVTRPKLEE